MNVLFIGDYRPARNYGSIATSEAMVNLIKFVIGTEHNLKIIDHRSFYNETPREGYPEYVMKLADNGTTIKKKLKILVPDFIWEYKNKIFKIDESKIHVPHTFGMYEDFYNEMLYGRKFVYERQALEWADVVIFSGEGTIVNGIDKYGKYLVGALYQLFMLWLSKIKFNRPTIIVNHTVDPGNNKEAIEMIMNIYPKLDFVGVRELASLEYLRNMGIKNGEFIPDALFTYLPKNSDWVPTDELNAQIDFTKPYICIGDTSGIIKNRYYAGVKWDVVEIYSKMILELKKVIPQIIFVDGFRGRNQEINRLIKKNGIGYVNLLNCSYHDLFYVLKFAEIFISGRWHNSILSVLANTPILLMGADSYKTKSLYDILEYNAPFFEVDTIPIYIDDIIDSTKNMLLNKKTIKSKLEIRVAHLREMAKNNISYLNQIIN